MRRVLRPTAIRELTVEGGPGYVAAASGLVRVGPHLYVIADDRYDLAAFPDAGQEPGRLRRMLPGDLPDDAAERKRAKPDFEALAWLPREGRRSPGGAGSPDGAGGPGGAGDALLALGSGSRPTRRRGVLWRLGDGGELTGEPEPIDLAPLYEELARAIPDLNVEGAAVSGDQFLLLQRGNGSAAVNAVARLDLRRVRADLDGGQLAADAIETIDRHDLGEADGVRLAFSDAAALPDGRVVYTAVAEAGDDIFHDGRCAGAGVGIIERDGELGRFAPLHPAPKVEGVEAHASGAAIDLLMVADADDPGRPAPLLAARLYPQ
jgi:hypothetical protein